ncbi:hypothetical protein LWC33_00045 [Pseudonocardia sp. RS11V-5]|uniref:hypothetical protein n=1 Tax=Pseudonocardia terrae TaxID=2905831 RepID=UPI001E5AFB14|nr:hypothetical protein [Pseudonocardia terrae]MCE3549845.1 hypothetical protein [Pseudonocardia terrae]
MGEDRHVDLGAVDLYGPIEQLLVSGPAADATHAGTGAARRDDALAAVAKLARMLEVPAEASDVDLEQARSRVTLLLVIRDFVEPTGEGADEHVQRYLEEVLDRLRRERATG